MKTAPVVPTYCVDACSAVEMASGLSEEETQRDKEPVSNGECNEMVLTAIEIGSVSHSPSKNRSEIVALHRHVIDEETCIPFMYWQGVEKYFRIRSKGSDRLYKFAVRE